MSITIESNIINDWKYFLFFLKNKKIAKAIESIFKFDLIPSYRGCFISIFGINFYIITGYK